MEIKDAANTFDALSHPGRLAVFRLLVRRGPDGVRPSDVADALALKPNTLSAYLSTLQNAGLVTSSRVGRAVFYGAEMPRMGALIDYLVADCCRGRPDLCGPGVSSTAPTVRLVTNTSTERLMTDVAYNVLFICTGNSARSIFAERLLADLGGQKFVAHSAGLDPASKLNPYAVEVLERGGHSVAGLRSKHISEFQSPDAPTMDFVFTVCDAAANEDCPPWPGQPITAHWGQPDPVKVTGTDAEKAFAFAETYRQMRRRVESFVNLPLQSLDRLALQTRLDEIGRPTP